MKGSFVILLQGYAKILGEGDLVRAEVGCNFLRY
jgi:hypothetical protein